MLLLLQVYVLAIQEYFPQDTLITVPFVPLHRNPLAKDEISQFYEEHPFTRTAAMGSRVYARRCRERGEKIRAMICLETIGYCSEQKGSQRLSFTGLLLPRRGDFIALVDNNRSKELLRETHRLFDLRPNLPCEAVTLPINFPAAWSSDHWSFWEEGYPAVMLTDTAPLRYRHYHTPKDTPEKVNYDFLTRVIDRLEAVVPGLAHPVA